MQRCIGGIFYKNRKKRRRNGGIVLVGGDERIKSMQRNLARKGRIDKVNLRKGKFAFKNTVFKVRKAHHCTARTPVAEVVQGKRAHALGIYIGVKNFCVPYFRTVVRFYCKVRKPVAAALGRAVENLPVNQLSVAGKSDASAADPP